MSDVTELLNAIDHGDPNAASRLLPVVYDELRRLARHRLASEVPGQTLDATALVHEAYLRLVGGNADQNWDGRGHFFASAAEAMRRILVENARRKRRHKHGGKLARFNLDEDKIAAPEPPDQLLALSEALDKLAAVDQSAAEMVKLRYFAGLTLGEAAKVLGISPRTADRFWAYARAWLRSELGAR